jgi:Ion transport protein
MAECFLKILAMSKDYFSCGWNIFDLLVVSASLLDLAFELIDSISVLRGLRLVREKLENLRAFDLFQLFSVARFETSAVLDDHEGAPVHYHLHAGRAGKPDLCAAYRHLHFCCDRNATVLQEVHRGDLPRRGNPKVRNINIFLNKISKSKHLCTV